MDFKTIYFYEKGVLRVLALEVIVEGENDNEMWFLASGALHQSLKFSHMHISVKEL